MNNSKLKIGGKVYAVEYVKALKNTSSVKVKDGKVILRLSRHLRGGEIDKTIEKFLKWAGKRLSNVNEFVTPTYADGGRISTHNKIYEISVIEEDRQNARAVLRNGHLIEIRLSRYEMGKVKFLAEKILIRDQLPYLNEVIDELNEVYFKVRLGQVRFKRMGSRFGSCARNGNISIALSVLFMPRDVFRYVCVHELAHLKEFNHSARFWALVTEAMPDWKGRRKWLKEHGFGLG